VTTESLETPAGEPRTVFVHATNYDGSSHWQHPAELVEARDDIVMTRTAAGINVKHERGVYVSPFNTRGHYWPDRWFNVIRLELPDPSTGWGRLTGWYCNIATPVQFDGESVRYVDLQLDVRVFAEDHGLRCSVLDEDEFETARERYAYPDDLVERARRAVDEVIELVVRRAFPFDR
jgi:protein associated with RNAse G/E